MGGHAWIRCNCSIRLVEDEVPLPQIPAFALLAASTTVMIVAVPKATVRYVLDHRVTVSLLRQFRFGMRLTLPGHRITQPTWLSMLTQAWLIPGSGWSSDVLTPPGKYKETTIMEID